VWVWVWGVEPQKNAAKAAAKRSLTRSGVGVTRSHADTIMNSKI